MTDFLHIPHRLNETWPWFNAVCSWDWGDVGPLAELIRTESIPDEYREAVASIISGERKRDKNWHKSKIPAAERMKLAGSISTIIDLCRVLKTGAADGIESMADRLAREPIDIVRELESEARKVQSDAAVHFDVSVETIKKLLRDMRSRIDRWPVV